MDFDPESHMVDGRQRLLRLLQRAAWFQAQRPPLSLQQINQPIRMTSDCSGQGSVLQALCHLGLGPRLHLKRSAECDSDKRKLLGAVHALGNICVETSGLLTDVAQHLDVAKGPPHSAGNIDFHEGGYPCQPYSQMGSKQGLLDARGLLWIDAIEILVRVSPSVFLLENVPGLATQQKFAEQWKLTLDILHQSGFCTTHRIQNTLLNGLPQERLRVYLVGVRNDVPLHHGKGSVGHVLITMVLQS